jgi:predicted CxxxxCH...CXXCH cytochrome family protein
MCHAAAPTTGAHTAHLSINGIHAGSSSIDYGSAANFTCDKCHAGTVTIVGNAKVINYPNHVNGVVNVGFDAVNAVSRAQISPASFNAYSTIWTRTNGYKVDATSVDVSKNLLSAGSFAGGTCSTIACHNNGTPAWGGGKLSCVDCHSKL